MAHIGPKKESIIHRRGMTEFKPKSASIIGTVSKTAAKDISAAKHSAERTMSKVATKQERAGIVSGVKKLASKVHKAATSPTAKQTGKAVMGFLRTWGESTKAKIEEQQKKSTQPATKPKTRTSPRYIKKRVRSKNYLRRG